MVFICNDLEYFVGYNDQNMSPTSTSTTSYLPGYLLGGNTQSSMPMVRTTPFL